MSVYKEIFEDNGGDANRAMRMATVLRPGSRHAR